MKHAQKNLSAGSDVRGGIIRIMNEQGSGVGACRCARLPVFCIISRQFKPEFHNSAKTIG
jgi:hypothetical protein